MYPAGREKRERFSCPRHTAAHRGPIPLYPIHRTPAVSRTHTRGVSAHAALEPHTRHSNPSSTQVSSPCRRTSPTPAVESSNRRGRGGRRRRTATAFVLPPPLRTAPTSHVLLRLSSSELIGAPHRSPSSSQLLLFTAHPLPQLRLFEAHPPRSLSSSSLQLRRPQHHNHLLHARLLRALPQVASHGGISYRGRHKSPP